MKRKKVPPSHSSAEKENLHKLSRHGGREGKGKADLPSSPAAKRQKRREKGGYMYYYKKGRDP